MFKKIIEKLKKTDYFNPIDIHFAKFTGEFEKENQELIALSAALVSRNLADGHICLDIEDYSKNKNLNFTLPETEKWEKALECSSLTGSPGIFKPLIFDGKRLYLYRYWDYENILIKKLKTMSQKERTIDNNIKEKLNILFDEENNNKINWQKVAAFMALKKHFCVISGGPGTGKTTTVAKILCLLLQEKENIKISLAAPTGKAAARMNEAIRKARLYLKEKVPLDLLNKIPHDMGKTIHRLLGSKGNSSPYFKHNSKNQLDYDVIIIDEASMIDLALMSKLIEAIKIDSRLILLGDKDQLASVEAGSVLGSICNGKYVDLFSSSFCNEYNSIEFNKKAKLTAEYIDDGEFFFKDSIINLKDSHRFKEKKGITVLASRVNKGEEIALKTFNLYKKEDGIVWHKVPSDIKKFMKNKVIDFFKDYIKAERIEDSLEKFNNFRVLCAIKEGPFGVLSFNRIIQEILKEAGLIETSGIWYNHRPVMITRNDYNLNLFNGDTGIARKDKEGRLRIYFPSSNGKDIRKFIPSLLPKHETVFAMTIHKSQGSEFNQVLIVLPERYNPVLTRELIYTGITRAKNTIEIIASKEIFKETVKKEIKRTSGLSEGLWE